MLGLEIDPDRVAAAAGSADPPRLEFARGGFELAGRRPVLVRALNVLRQYDEAAAADAWTEMCGRLGARRRCWSRAPATSSAAGPAGSRSTPSGPLTITLSLPGCADLDRPSDLAERLPKALIHHNVPGQPVHALLQAFDRAWAVGAPYSALRAAAALAGRGGAAGRAGLAGGRRSVSLASR